MRQLNISKASLSAAAIIVLVVSIGIVADSQLSFADETSAIKKTDPPNPTAPQQADEAEAEAEAEKQASLKQITYDIKYLSSDEMGGRRPGTPGIELAVDYIVQEYKKAGLKPLEDGTYLQEMEVGRQRVMDKEKTKLVFNGANDSELKLELGKNFQQLTARESFDLESELVFVGYGISAFEDHNYDDYADIDVEDKIVVLIRREPQANDESSVFDGARTSRHASGRAKVTAARRAGAAGVIMVNDGATATDDELDELIASDRFGTLSIPFAQIKRSVFNELLKTSPLTSPAGKTLDTLKKIEDLIDKKLEPISQPIVDCTAQFESVFHINKVKTSNIIGIIEGEGPNADETIVIGAHYDHLGDGAYGSRDPQGRREIHNGADDNATGTVAVIELARRINKRDKKPGRRLVFICFTAEEMGLLGAFHYVNDPIYPLEKTAAMINFDMIGWLRENRLTLYNGKTSPQFGPIFEEANSGFGFELKIATGGGSDQIPFNQKEIPNMFIHTGQNAVYHTPEDDFEAINCEGALKVIDFSERVVNSLASLEKMPTYGTPRPPRLGVMIDDADGTVIIEGVTSGSIAEKAGLKEGDIILEVDGVAITKRRQINVVVRRDAGKTVKMKLKRDDTEILLNVELKKAGGS